eukprot:7194305-Ditylum_brightwellii.AAC.1
MGQEKKNGSLYSNPSRKLKQIQKCIFTKHGIEQASYHGGDLAMAHVQVLFQKATSLFSDMETAMNNELDTNRQSNR